MARGGGLKVGGSEGRVEVGYSCKFYGGYEARCQTE